MGLKAWMSWTGVVLVTAGLAQGNPPGKGKTGGVEWGSPDVTIVVREHSTTADIVQVTMARADYPVDLLRSQLENLGRELGIAPRGLAVAKVNLDPQNPNLQFVKASFGTNGILDRKEKSLNIQPVLRAFAGAPEPYTIDDVLIIFDGERPSPKTVKSHRSEAVVAEASFVNAPAEIEYHIHLKTQDPAKIDFPAQAPEPLPQAKPSDVRTGPSFLFYAALGMAALAVGALVYLALLRGGSKARR